MSDSKILENMREGDLAICRRKLLDDAFETMMKNNSQYGWEIWKDKPYKWWVKRELKYYQDQVENLVSNKHFFEENLQYPPKSRYLLDILVGVHKGTILNLSEREWGSYFTEVYQDNGILKLTPIGLLILFCSNKGRFEDLF